MDCPPHGFHQMDEFTELECCELTQISINKYKVDFIFLEGFIVAIESIFEHISSNERKISRFEIYGVEKEISVHNLIGQTVRKTNVVSEDTFDIIFHNDEKVRILRDCTRRESCQIHTPTGVFIIS